MEHVIKTAEAVKRPILQGEYKLVRPIYSTENSIMYLGCSLQASEKRYAIRESRVENNNSPEQREQISSYFQPIAVRYMELLYPGLTSLRDFFVENGYLYFVYDYVEGYRLSEIFNMRTRPFTEVQALHIALQIANSVNYLHNIVPPIFFADFNPTNIILGTAGNVVLTDYGLEHLMSTYQPEAPRMGILGYAAPEQIGPLGIVSRYTDIYGLGVLMHQLVTGLDPTRKPNKLCPISEVNIAISEDYMQIVETATASKPEDRFVSMEDFVYAINAIAPVAGRANNVLDSGAGWLR